MKKLLKYLISSLSLICMLVCGMQAVAAQVKLEVLNPVGIADTKTVTPANRLDTLEGKSIGLIWNGKPGGQHLLDELEKQLSIKYKGTTFVRMKSTPQLSTEEMIDVIKAAPKVDAVIHAVGD